MQKVVCVGACVCVWVHACVCVRECLHNDSIKQKNGDSTYLDMVGLF